MLDEAKPFVSLNARASSQAPMIRIYYVVDIVTLAVCFVCCHFSSHNMILMIKHAKNRMKKEKNRVIISHTNRSLLPLEKRREILFFWPINTALEWDRCLSFLYSKNPTNVPLAYFLIHICIISVGQFLFSHRTKKKNIQMSQTILIDDLKAKNDDISSGKMRNVPRETQQLYHCQWLIGSEEEKHSKDVFD